MKGFDKTINSYHDDMLRRTLALTIQACLLNSLSLITMGIAALVNAVFIAFMLAHSSEAATVAQAIYNNYLEVPEYAVVICSSNIGFIVHCYYSKLYREAVQETFVAVKAAYNKYVSPCGIKFAKNWVHPQSPQ